MSHPPTSLDKSAQQARQPLHFVADGLRLEGRVAEDQPRGLRPEGVRRQRRHVEVTRAKLAGQTHVVDAGREPAEQVHAAVGLGEAHWQTRPTRGLEEDLLALGIVTAAAPDVRIEGATVDERGEHGLIHEWPVIVDNAA